MEKSNLNVSDQSKAVDEKRQKLMDLKKRFRFVRQQYKNQTKFLKTYCSDYQSQLEKQNPSNDQAFSRIGKGVRALLDNLGFASSKLSLLDKALHSMETIVDSTNDSDINLFMDYAKRVPKPLEEVAVKTKQNVEIITVLFKEIEYIRESKKMSSNNE